jgi:hypothetical protein
MKQLQEDADEAVEYTEMMNEANSSISGADGSAYITMFTTTSTSGILRRQYFDEA